MRHILPAGLLALVLTGCVSDFGHDKFGSPYTNPLVSPGTQFAAVPPAVQNTIRAQAGIAEIERISERKRYGTNTYVVEFRESLSLPPMVIARNGSVLNPDYTVAVGAADTPGGASQNRGSDLALADLPGKAYRALADQAPPSEVASIHKETWGERQIYIFTFKDPDRNPRIYIMEDGTVLKGWTEERTVRPARQITPGQVP